MTYSNVLIGLKKYKVGKGHKTGYVCEYSRSLTTTDYVGQ